MKPKRILSVLLIISMLAAMTVMTTIVASAGDVMQNTASKFQKFSTSAANMLTTPLEPAKDTEGITLWIRVQGMQEPAYLGLLSVQAEIHHYDFEYEEETDEFGNKFPVMENGKPKVKEEKDPTIDTMNHGQDGLRNASFKLDKSGDYLLYIPFKPYSFSHEMLGNDYIKKITGVKFGILEVSSKNKNAQIALMGVFENKVASYKTSLVTEKETKEISGTYTYKQSEVLTKETTPANPNYTNNCHAAAQRYDEKLGITVRVAKDDAAAVEAGVAIDYTETVKTTWTYAYVNDVLPAAVGGITDANWMDKASAGSAMIPVNGNSLYASNNVSVTFVNEGKETVVDVPYGTAATIDDPTKEGKNNFTYKFDKWVDSEGNAANLSNVTENITVYATYTETYANPYTDVDMERWYADAVKYAAKNELMDGMTTTTFEPNTQTTRGMLVTVLYRIEGRPSVADLEDTPFTDVAAGRYYSDPIKWAYNNDVVEGMTDTEFAPEKIVTREQLATMVYRYADKVKNYNMDIGKLTTLGTFKDKNDISNYATTAVKWALDKEYIKGYKDGDDVYMKPKNGATRAEMMAVLMRFVEDEHKTK